jgi:hypothetical protein
MESKQDYKIARIAFLEKFTEEIIFNLTEEHKSKKRVHIEKLKQKFLGQENSPPEEFGKMVNHKILHPIKYQKIEERPKNSRGIMNRLPLISNILSHKPKIEQNVPTKPQLPAIEEAQQQEIVKSIKPEYQPRPPELNLGKLEPILQDPVVQSIECPGPGKNVLVNKFGKINVTKIVLTKEDIDGIIGNFSNLAKIPLSEGILKAAVGNLMISAVTSEIVGSRFIIDRINPQVSAQPH